ncbi:cdp-alcohol phosphatidyltransferase protein [Fusarium sporotrichioides]|uniref:Cdp-alcohol phosphatidyltransferase protein n=1 Tax=Fusarium sporotrichioides TaxID=5514 RepID=A0A395RBZ5_FUSSP|nr:cdp-alcohol phosphatidyltransferase protein [Fusarium sporotrichioides]
MPSLRTIVLATAASAVTLVNADYVIDPESVPLSLRKVWCQNEIETCPMICGQTSKGDTKVNECNPKTLTYGCICGDGKQPNVSEYSLTLPFYVCQEWGNQCVTDCGGSASCASDCRENNPCGAEDPKKYNTTSTATGTGAVKATASATDDGTTVYTDTPGSESNDDDSDSAASTKTNGAAVIEVGRTWGLTIVLSTIFAGFAML